MTRGVRMSWSTFCARICEFACVNMCTCQCLHAGHLRVFASIVLGGHATATSRLTTIQEKRMNSNGNKLQENTEIALLDGQRKHKAKASQCG